MQMRPLGSTGLEIAPLVFGGNVFGWTADEKRSFELLDLFVDTGFNAIDTADSYSRWADGHVGGESETIIGNWLKANPAKRDKVVVFTKVGSDMGQGKKDLSAKWIVEEVEHSLKRLGIERIDLYFSHWPDPTVEHEETLRAYETLIGQGKVRSIGASNYDAKMLADALDVAKDNGLPRYEVIQPVYNLYMRETLEGALLDTAKAENIGVVTYSSLGSGFLSGKYRSRDDASKSPRGGGIMDKYMNERGLKILGAVEEMADRHGATMAEIAIAWIVHRDGVTAPIASATSAEQLHSLMKAASLALSADDMAALDAASA